MNVLFMVTVAFAGWWGVSLAVAMMVGAVVARREHQTGFAEGDEAHLEYPHGGERSLAVDLHLLADGEKPPARRLAVVREASRDTMARRTTAA